MIIIIIIIIIIQIFEKKNVFFFSWKYNFNILHHLNLTAHTV